MEPPNRKGQRWWRQLGGRQPGTRRVQGCLTPTCVCLTGGANTETGPRLQAGAPAPSGAHGAPPTAAPGAPPTATSSAPPIAASRRPGQQERVLGRATGQHMPIPRHGLPVPRGVVLQAARPGAEAAHSSHWMRTLEATLSPVGAEGQRGHVATSARAQARAPSREDTGRTWSDVRSQPAAGATEKQGHARGWRGEGRPTGSGWGPCCRAAWPWAGGTLDPSLEQAGSLDSTMRPPSPLVAASLVKSVQGPGLPLATKASTRRGVGTHHVGSLLLASQLLQRL